MKRYLSLIIVLSIIWIFSCTEYLDYTPRGTISTEQLNSPQAIDGLVTAAYASLGNDDREWSCANVCMCGSIRAEDAYKGGGGGRTSSEWHESRTFSALRVDSPDLNMVWTAI